MVAIQIAAPTELIIQCNAEGLVEHAAAVVHRGSRALETEQVVASLPVVAHLTTAKYARSPLAEALTRIKIAKQSRTRRVRSSSGWSRTRPHDRPRKSPTSCKAHQHRPAPCRKAVPPDPRRKQRQPQARQRMPMRQQISTLVILVSPPSLSQRCLLRKNAVSLSLPIH